MDNLIYAWQWFIYKVLKRDPHIDDRLKNLPDTLEFTSHYDKKADLHWLECPALPDFYVTGKNKEELARNVADTLLVYFDVPTYVARKYSLKNINFNFENQKTGEHEYVSLGYLDELRASA